MDAHIEMVARQLFEMGYHVSEGCPPTVWRKKGWPEFERWQFELCDAWLHLLWLRERHKSVLSQ